MFAHPPIYSFDGLFVVFITLAVSVSFRPSFDSSLYINILFRPSTLPITRPYVRLSLRCYHPSFHPLSQPQATLLIGLKEYRVTFVWQTLHTSLFYQIFPSFILFDLASFHSLVQQTSLHYVCPLFLPSIHIVHLRLDETGQVIHYVVVPSVRPAGDLPAGCRPSVQPATPPPTSAAPIRPSNRPSPGGLSSVTRERRTAQPTLSPQQPSGP